MKLLTKVAKGVAYGDVSNQAIRNVLTELSKSISSGMTEQEMYDTLEYFEWKCPYTGRDLRKAIETKDGSYATDHIYPQNREGCGLNVKGNLIVVDRRANSKKHDQDVETFLLKDTEVLGNLSLSIRQARLQKIKDFQKACGYDPEGIRTAVSSILKAHYDEVRELQEKCIKDTLDALEKAGIHALAKTTTSATVATPAASPKTKKRKASAELIFHPADEQQFKKELLKSKKAHFVLTYDSGKKVESPWNANKFKETSDLRANIESRPFWINGNKEGLVKVEVLID